MKRKSLALAAAGVVVACPLFLAGGTARASAPPVPLPPAGYHLSYSHNFTASGLSGWNVWPGSTAPVKTGKDGVAVTVTKADQTAEVVSNGAVVTPESFIQARAYLPAIKGQITNFPAFWTLSANYQALWNKHVKPGEIDLVEGLHGQACAHTHYAGQASGPAGVCAPKGTIAGWHTFSALWRNNRVSFWYDSTYVGALPLPVSLASGNELLLFQNRSYGSFCTECYGPPQYPASAWLSWVKIWRKS